MINAIANKIGKLLAEPTANSKYYKDQYTKEQVEQILIYDMTGRLKEILWVVLLIIFTFSLLMFGYDIRITTLIAYIIIKSFRRKFGGYHANSEVVCMIITTFIPLMVGYMSITMDLNVIHITVIYLFAYVSAIKNGVVDHPNRRFEEGNKVLNLKMKKRLFMAGMATLSLVTVLQFIIYYKEFVAISNAISLGVFISFINLYFGK